jgi:hypothetical protein
MPNEYREQLPDKCPPEAAQEISTNTEVFRLVKSNPATEEDFRSYQALAPIKKFRVGECIARGLSVLVSQTAADNTRKLPRYKATHVCRVKLCAGAGKLMQTGDNADHRTWWPFADFAILNHCEVMP